MNLPITLRSSKRELLPFVVGALLFVLASVWLGKYQPGIGWMGILVFGFFGVVAALRMLPNSSYLHLTTDEFTVRNVFRDTTVAWRDVKNFGVTQMSARRLVGWDPVDESKINSVNKNLSGYSSVFAENYGMTAEELATLLNRLREEHGRSV